LLLRPLYRQVLASTSTPTRKAAAADSILPQRQPSALVAACIALRLTRAPIAARFVPNLANADGHIAPNVTPGLANAGIADELAGPGSAEGRTSDRALRTKNGALARAGAAADRSAALLRLWEGLQVSCLLAALQRLRRAFQAG
jgi:hypothetical protein